MMLLQCAEYMPMLRNRHVDGADEYGGADADADAAAASDGDDCHAYTASNCGPPGYAGVACWWRIPRRRRNFGIR